ncbi:hypothetical protein CD122_07000 [Staphylococcus rostri]|uniref:Uncharacterized protein n=1 Tax=Staphylococcus rostri TaxID=522262 RepID=A0A2K3YP20_9STAP|nr:hypothetical protein CD122_07000 [Staphylococcus rostri]
MNMTKNHTSLIVRFEVRKIKTCVMNSQRSFLHILFLKNCHQHLSSHLYVQVLLFTTKIKFRIGILFIKITIVLSQYD